MKFLPLFEEIEESLYKKSISLLDIDLSSSEKLNENNIGVFVAYISKVRSDITLNKNLILSKSLVLEQKTNTYNKAKEELDLLSTSSSDKNDRPIIEPFKKEILALCEKFGKSGQSGGSAPYVASAISQAVNKLLLQQSIVPITGNDDEWIKGQFDDKTYQNKRCYALFKDKERGQAYYLDAIVFKNQKNIGFSGSCWLNKKDYLREDKSKMITSRQYVKKFPFNPKTFYIDVIEKEFGENNYEMFIKDPKQLKEVFAYYDKFILKV